jgi:hypothetical protein
VRAILRYAAAVDPYLTLAAIWLIIWAWMVLEPMPPID